jgi:hypothetical protein
MADDVNLVGSRVSVMHLAYDCLGCLNTVAVSSTDGRTPDEHRRLVQARAATDSDPGAYVPLRPQLAGEIEASGSCSWLSTL